ncbi:unnamed protein product [Symbiodinium natans]|uniref:Uncharacterized protein n=1 Tax=Symbiodinium natans TaxID=878477 RepID=A0A812VGD3_9DINO|nr:unnamed protein product [Symbiodinium natans]
MVYDDASGSQAGSQKWRFQSLRSIYQDLKKNWWPSGPAPDEEAPADHSEEFSVWRCCPRRFQPTGQEEPASPGHSPRQGKRGSFPASSSFCSAPSHHSSASVGGDDLLPQPQFNPEEFLRHECQSDLVDRFLQDYRKLAAYEAAATASVRTEEGVLPREVTVQSFPSQSVARSESGILQRSPSAMEVQVSGDSDHAQDPDPASVSVKVKVAGRTKSAEEDDDEVAGVASVTEASQSPASEIDAGSMGQRAEAPEVPAEANPERTTSMPGVQSDEQSPRTWASKEAPSDSAQSPELSQPPKETSRGAAGSRPGGLRVKSEPLRPLLEVEEQGSSTLISQPVALSALQTRPKSPTAKQKHLVFMVDGEELQILGVDTRDSSVPPEESPSRNRPAAGAGPLPPPEDKVSESNSGPTGEGGVDAQRSNSESCEKDVLIQLVDEDPVGRHQPVKRSSPPEKRCEDLPPSRHIQGDEEALAALEVASWPPTAPTCTKEPDAHEAISPTSEEMTPLPSPPAAPATPLPVTPLPAPVTPVTPVPAVSPGPSRSRIAGAAAAAARAAAGARHAMAAAGRVSTATGGAALATLVSPEVSSGGTTDRRNSVFSGRFMPLSLWAQAESTTPPVSGPGSPERAKYDAKTDLEATKPDQDAGAAGGASAECASSCDVRSETKPDGVDHPTEVNSLPTPPMAPAEQRVFARGASAPPDPCRAKGDSAEADATPMPRPASAEAMAPLERGRLPSGSGSSPHAKEEWTGTPYTSPRTPVRGRRGAPPSSAASLCSPLSPSSMSDSNEPDHSPARFDVPQMTQVLSQSSYPSPSTHTHTEVADETEVLEDILIPAPFADHEERVSTVPSAATDTCPSDKQEAWRELPSISEDARALPQVGAECRNVKVDSAVPFAGNESSAFVSMPQNAQGTKEEDVLHGATNVPASNLGEDEVNLQLPAPGGDASTPTTVEECQKDPPGLSREESAERDHCALEEAAASTVSTCVGIEAVKPRCTSGRDDKQLELEPARRDSELILPEEEAMPRETSGTSGPCFGKKHFVIAAGSVCSSDPDAMSTTPGPLDDHDSDWPFARMCYEGPDAGAGKLYIHQRLRRSQARGKKRPSTYKDEVDCLRLQAGLDVDPAY